MIRLFSNSFFWHLIPIVIHFRFSTADKIVFIFILGLFSFAATYYLVRFLIFVISLFRKKKEKTNIRAFYITVIALLVNNIISIFLNELESLLKMNLLESLDFLRLIAFGTTPFFAVLLPILLVVFLMKRKDKKKEKIGDFWDNKY
jgi:chromate transport protein ChrA